jgi:AcrR family transcriptional regulator
MEKPPMEDDRDNLHGDAPARRRRSGKEVEEAILETAREVFAERGFDGTTMREVAHRAHIHEPTLYRHYPSKEALFDEAVLTKFDQDVIETFGNIGSSSLRLENLADVIGPMLSFFSQNRRLLFVVLERGTRVDARENPAMWRVVEQVGQAIDAVAPLVQSPTIRHGAITKEDAWAFAALLLSATIGMALLEPVFPETKHGLTTEVLVQQLSARHEARAPELAGFANANSVRVLELLQKILEANRVATQAQIELEKLTH